MVLFLIYAEKGKKGVGGTSYQEMRYKENNTEEGCKNLFRTNAYEKSLLLYASYKFM